MSRIPSIPAQRTDCVQQQHQQPFQEVTADFCYYVGRHYLVVSVTQIGQQLFQ